MCEKALALRSEINSTAIQDNSLELEAHSPALLTGFLLKPKHTPALRSQCSSQRGDARAVKQLVFLLLGESARLPCCFEPARQRLAFSQRGQRFHFS